MDLRLMHLFKIGLLAFTCIIIAYSLRYLYVVEGHLRKHPIPYPAGIKWSAWAPRPFGATLNSSASAGSGGDYAADGHRASVTGFVAANASSSNASEIPPFAWLATGAQGENGSAEIIRPALSAKARVGKVTVASDPMEATTARVLQTHERHDDIHGYPLYVLRPGMHEDHWTKTSYLLSLLLKEMEKHPNERLQWLLWFDERALVMNPNIPLEIFLPPPEFTDIHLVLGQTPLGFDSGVFAVRVNRWTIELMSSTTTYHFFRSDSESESSSEAQTNDSSTLERVFDEVLDEASYRKHLSYLPPAMFGACEAEGGSDLNQTGRLRHGVMLWHCPESEAHLDRVQVALDVAEQRSGEWELPLNQTTYLDEVREFWRQRKHDEAVAIEQAKNTTDTANKLMDGVRKHLQAFGDQLDEADQKRIKEQMAVVQKLQETKGHNTAKLGKALEGLREAAESLDAVVADARAKMHEHAHAVLFEAEKAMVEATSPDDEQLVEDVEDVEGKVGRLRTILVEAADDEDKIRQATEVVALVTSHLVKKIEEEKVDSPLPTIYLDATAIVAASSARETPVPESPAKRA
ncbi:MAG: hypothetical protein M1838_005076 [Thelocarpon superellum]|nr:MAG: hypothetical protein M1838_005076 [Thelocarpon superellum]